MAVTDDTKKIERLGLFRIEGNASVKAVQKLAESVKQNIENVTKAAPKICGAAVSGNPNAVLSTLFAVIHIGLTLK